MRISTVVSANTNVDGIVIHPVISSAPTNAELASAVNSKVNKPETDGIPGQVLGLDNSLNSVWMANGEEASYAGMRDLMCPDFTETTYGRAITKTGATISSRYV